MATNPKPKKAKVVSIIRFIGDVHGKFGRYEKIVKESPYATIQVGDMGVGFRKWPHGEWSSNPPYDTMVEHHACFIRGNHDNPDTCARHTQWISDGHCTGTGIMFIGGALSIDKAYRVPGYSWWEDEELPQIMLDRYLDRYIKQRPQIMVTHECPETVAALILGKMADLRQVGASVKLDPRFASRTRVAFQRMFELHQPKLWIFGHWHVPFAGTINGTAFICLPELATIDIDTETGVQNPGGPGAVC